jgi:type IV pilus assembly protein PilB
MAVSATNTALGGLSRRLVQDGLIPEDAVLQALKGAQAQNITLVAYLVGREMIEARKIAISASSEFGVPLLDLDAIDLDMEAVKSVDQRLLAKHQVLPLVLRGKRLFLAVADPTDLPAIDEIKFQSGLRVDTIIVEQDKLAAMVSKALEAVDTSMSSFGEDDFDLESLEITGGDDDIVSDDVARDDIEDAPVVRFVNKIMLDAIKRGASDIHFEPYEKTYRVRTRLDGVLKQVASPPLALSNKVTARLKVMSRLDIAERRVPQDGRIKLRLSKNRAIDFRVNSCPTLFGEKVVLRILDPTAAKLGIEVLGYEDFQRKLYLDALAKPYGMILVTGPTGSGKTVSLYTGINILNTEDRNISTCEDPVEINVPGINQVNVNPKVGLHFATALKAFLRQDPDVIMVGEIRDLETAETAIKAAQTGHLVLSTLHTNDAPRTLSRLVDMGVKPYAIATSIHLIIAQRLARRLCEQCKELRDIPEEALVLEGFTRDDVHGGLRIFGPVGCKSCNDGYKGRVGIYQVMPVTEAIGRIILAGGNAVQIEEQSVKDGVWTLRRSALHKVKMGVTSLEEINRVTLES